MKDCWSPWYFYDNVKSGSYAVAATTIFFSVLGIIYASYCLAGGDSSQFFMPLFETDIRFSMIFAGSFLILWYMFFIATSLLMIEGIRIYHRGRILPWLAQNLLYILMLVAYCIWLQASYYHHLMSVLWTIIWMLYTCIHIYMHRCVKAQYEIIKESQAPKIVMLQDPFYE